MIQALLSLVSPITSGLKNQTGLALENLALRQQLAVLNRKRPQRRLKRRDRFFWECPSQVWNRRRERLIIFKPETVVRWHRKRFALHWAQLSRRKAPGRPGIAAPSPAWSPPCRATVMIPPGFTLTFTVCSPTADCLVHPPIALERPRYRAQTAEVSRR